MSGARWPRLRLKFISAKPICNGVGEPSDHTEPSWPRYVRITDIAGPRALREDTFRSLPPEIAAGAPLDVGDVLVAAVGATFGKAYLHEHDIGPACFAGYLVRIRPNARVRPAMLAYWMESQGYWDQVRTAVVQATVQNFSAEKVRQLRMPLPPVDMQHAIAAFLDRKTAEIDALIAKKERLLELLEEKRTALITQAVTKGITPGVEMTESGVEWLGRVPAHWEVAPLYSRYQVALGKMLDAKRIVGDHLRPYIRNVDVQWDHVAVDELPSMDFELGERGRYGLTVGDLLVCEGGEVGRTAMWRGELEECYYQKAVHRLRPYRPEEQPRYFYYVMYAAARLGMFVATGNPNTIDHLTADQLSHHRFPFPPSAEQAAIVSGLDRDTKALDSLATNVGDAIALLREYRTALITAAVTGQIEVRT